MVRILAFYSDDLSWNPAGHKIFSVLFYRRAKINQNMAWDFLNNLIHSTSLHFNLNVTSRLSKLGTKSVEKILSRHSIKGLHILLKF